MNLQRFTSKFSRIQNTNKLFFSLFFTFAVYTLVTLVVVLNLSKISAFDKQSETDKNVVEALITPPVNINVSDVFRADPLSTSNISGSVIGIRDNINFLIFSTLFKQTPNGDVQKDLVKNYTFKDAKELNIELNENVYWHDGEKLTAADVIFTLNQIRSLGSSNIYSGALNGGNIDYSEDGDYHIKISLIGKDRQYPNAAYLNELTFPILPKHKLESYNQVRFSNLSGTEFGMKPIGSGILEYKENKGGELELQKNDNYYGKKVSFDKYIFRFYKTFDKISDDFALKNLNLFTRESIAGKDDVHEKLVKDGAIPASTTIKNISYALYFNLNDRSPEASPFISSFYLRSSLLKIIDRNKILESLNGYGRPMYGPIDKTSWAFLSDLEAEQALNIEEFKKRVESQGYKKEGTFYSKEGKNLNLSITYLAGVLRERLVDQLKKLLEENGVEIKLVPVGIVNTKPVNNTVQNASPIESRDAQIDSIINNRRFEAIITSVSHYQDPDRYSEWDLHQIEPPGLNIAGYDSNIASAMLSQGRIENDPEKRKDKYIRFQKAFIQDVPAIYLINPVIVNYHSPNLTGLDNEVINSSEYKYQNISDWKVATK